MDFLDLARNRYSVRSFSNRAIEQEKIDAILEAGRVAPTACNLQPQKVLVIKGEEALAKYRKCTECHYNAPLALLVCYDKKLCWKRSYDGKTSGDIDCAIVTTQMMLQASSLGIGSTWIMYFIPEAVRTEFELPDNYVPVSILALGYPSEDAFPSPRHSLIKAKDDTISYDKY